MAAEHHHHSGNQYESLIGAVVVAVCLVVAVIVGHSFREKAPAKDAKRLVAPTAGAKNPTVEVVVFGSLTSRDSAYTTSVALRLAHDFPRDVRVRYHLSGYNDSTLLARAALAAHRQGRFWAFLGWAYGFNKALEHPQARFKLKQRFDLDNEKVAHKKIEQWVKANRLDWKRFNADMHSEAVKTYLLREASRAGFSGRSALGALLINGTMRNVKETNYLGLKRRVEREIRRVRHKRGVAGSLVRARMLITAENTRGKDWQLFLKTIAGSDEPSWTPKPPRTRQYVPVWPKTDFIQGPRDAPVTFVVFSDFRCPHCGRAAETFRRLRAEYPRDLRVVFKFFPLPKEREPQSWFAAKAALAAGQQGRFWPYHDRLFATAERWSRRRGTDFVFRIARELGLEMARFRRDLASSELDKRLQFDLALVAKLGFSGTPGLFVNGAKIPHYPYLELWRWIEFEKLRAASLRRQGVASSKWYSLLSGKRPDSTPPRTPSRPTPTEKKPSDSLLRAGRFRVPVRPTDAQLGPQNAPVTAVHFLDLSVPANVLALRNLLLVRRRFEAQLRVVVRHDPRAHHRAARQMALLSIALQRRGQFWLMLDRLPRQGTIDLASIWNAVAALKLDKRQLERAMKESATREWLDGDRLDARLAGSTWEHKSYLNGRLLKATAPLDALADAVRFEAQALRGRLVAGRGSDQPYRLVLESGRLAGPHLQRESVRLPDDGSPSLGSRTAPLRLVLFRDPTGEADARLSTALESWLAENGRGSRVRIVFKHVPDTQRPGTELAALAVLAADRLGKYVAYCRALFANRGKRTRAKLIEYARDVEIKPTEFEALLADRRVADQLRRDRQLAKQVGVRETPVLFVDGRRLVFGGPLEPGLVREMMRRRLQGVVPKPKR